jgi:sugar phosphate isomerase/epimerase
MNKQAVVSRRRFFMDSTRFVLATGLAGVPARTFTANTPARWPISIRDAHLKITGQPDCWAAMKRLGVSGVEVEINEQLLCFSLYHPAKPYRLDTPDGIRALRDDLAAQGATLTAFCMHNRLDERLEQEVAWTRKVVQAAHQLGAHVVRIDVVPHQTPADQFLPLAIKACKQLCETAEGTPVRFGIENHGRVTNDPQFLDKLFDGVGSPRLGLTLDALNFYWFGHPLDELYGICEKFAPRAYHTHCKSARYPEDKRNTRRPIGWEYEKYAAPIYAGDIDYKRVATILRQAGYRGDLCLENECLAQFPAAERPDVLRKEIAMLKGLT